MNHLYRCKNIFILQFAYLNIVLSLLAGVCGVILGSVLCLKSRKSIVATELVKMSATSAASLSLLSLAFSGTNTLKLFALSAFQTKEIVIVDKQTHDTV